MPLKKNQVIPLQITSLSNDGNGVGHFDGMAIFVPYTAVGDKAAIRIVKVCKNYAFGILENLENPGPGRQIPECPLFTKCGGCQFQHLSYETELIAKEQFVRDAMQRLGGISHSVLPILPSPLALRYRNKVQYPLCQNEKGEITFGFFAGRSHRVIPCSDCLLQPQLLNRIAKTICTLLTKFHISIYNEETHTGLVRHLYLRHAISTNEVLVCLVCNGNTIPYADQFCLELKDCHPEIGSIVINVNTKQTNVITGEQCITLLGNGLLSDEMAGVPVELGPLSFYQVNTLGANQLYDVVQKFAAPTKRHLILDLYCGAGTIGLSMASHCEKLIGVEIVPQAVESAQKNAARMHVEHATFFCADAGQASQQLAQQNLKPDTIILDPPRKGCDQATLEAVFQMDPERLVMVSCNASTAARDVKWLVEKGYFVHAIQPVDMFPRTKHVETVVLLSKGEIDSKKVRVEFSLEDMDMSDFQDKATYTQIKDYVLEHSGLKVSNLYISQIKRKCGLEVGKNYNLPKAEDSRQPQCPSEKENAIREAMKYFGMI